MEQPENYHNKTGQVTIGRNSKRPMPTSVWRCFIICFLLLTVTSVVWFFMVRLGDPEVFDWVYLVLDMVLIVLPFIVISSFGNMGSRVEQVCFDYDAKQIVVSCANMWNVPREVVIPFERFWFNYHQPPFHILTYPRFRFYSGKEKTAVVVLGCFGWDKNQSKNSRRSCRDS